MYRVFQVVALLAVATAQVVIPGSRQANYGFRALPQRLNPPQKSQAVPFNTALLPERLEQFAASTARQIIARAEAADAVEAPAAAVKEVADADTTNIYGEKIEACGQTSSKAGKQDEICSYEADSPQVCVDVKKLADSDGSTPLNLKVGNVDVFKGVNRIGAAGLQCLSIWAVGAAPAASGIYGPGYFGLQCNALSSKVLSSEYTQAEFENCDLLTKEYRYGEMGHVEKIYKEGKLPGKCRRFRKAIKTICSDCTDKARTDAAKAAITASCAKFQEGDDAPELSALESGADRTNYALPSILFTCSAALAALGFNRVRRYQRFVQSKPDPLLQA